VERHELETRIRDLAPWFHNLRLDGIETAPDHFLGDYPATHWHTFEHALPERLDGCTVLDVGCNAGYFSIALKRRGAARVVGIDADPRYLAQARLAADLTGVAIELRQMNVYDVAALNERFDIVLFLGVLYHLRYPLLALDLLHQHVVKDILVCQTMLRGSPAVEPLHDDYPFTETAIFDRPAFPRLHFVEHNYADDWTNWWIPNRACAEAMLRSAGFDIAHNPAAEVFVCRRREITGSARAPSVRKEPS
jgi:tRNA (mo5U34)-methyltransferase